MLSVEEAREKILAHIQPTGPEQVFLDEALGRALAAEVGSARRLPPWDNSAMDGFAVRAGEIAPGRSMSISMTIGAGDAPGTLRPGTVARIMTGAPVPDGADAIVKREDTKEHRGDEGESVRFDIAPSVGAHVRRAGDDVAAGARVLDAGDVITPGAIGLLAAIGRTLVTVHRRPRVAIISTGSELVEADRAPGPGQIVGSNGHALAAQCREAGALPTVLPLARDDKNTIRATFQAALAAADMVLSSGGVSVGDFDYVKDVLDELGVVQEFWKVAMKPGKPVTFGHFDVSSKAPIPVFGLPGNPASSMVGFELFVRPSLRKMAGARSGWERPRVPVVLADAYHHEGSRRHYLRGHVLRDGRRLVATVRARQGSGMLTSMVGINALVEIAEDAGTVAAGGETSALLLDAV